MLQSESYEPVEFLQACLCSEWELGFRGPVTVTISSVSVSMPQAVDLFELRGCSTKAFSKCTGVEVTHMVFV